MTKTELTNSKSHDAVRRVFIITLALNLLVAGSKLLCGFLINSLSMVADGFHSLLDGASNVVGIIGIQISSRPPDHNHPYGHRKFEAISAMMISFFIFSACLQILKEAISRIAEHGFLPQSPVVPTETNWISYGVMLATLCINIAVSRYEAKQGRLLKSPLLLADAKHTQSDIYATLAVIVSLISVQLGFYWMDLLVAAVMGVIVFRAGFDIIALHLGDLVDEAALTPEEVKAVVLGTLGVLGCHRVRTRGSAGNVFVDLHIQVNAQLSLKQAHAISHQVENNLKRAFDGSNDRPSIMDVLVHVEEEGDTDLEIGAVVG